MDPGIDYFYINAIEQVKLQELEKAYNHYINNQTNIVTWLSSKTCRKRGVYIFTYIELKHYFLL